MLFVRPLTPEETKLLRTLGRGAIGRVSERAHLILRSTQGLSVSEIAEEFGYGEAWVREWIHRFNQKGVEGLYDHPRSGRPREVDCVGQSILRAQIQQSPPCSGLNFGIWTIISFTFFLKEQFNLALSPSTVRHWLKKLGFRWKRPRLSTPKRRDPDAQDRIEAIKTSIAKATPDTVILAEDETEFHLVPVLRAMWAAIGKQVRLPTLGRGNPKSFLFGAVNLITGQLHTLIAPYKRTGWFVALMERLVDAYTDRPILLLVDQGKIHTSKAVATFLQAHPQVELLFLPKYDPQANPIERIWGYFKDTVVASRYFGTLQKLEEAIRRACRELTHQKALNLCGKTSSNFFKAA